MQNMNGCIFSAKNTFHGGGKIKRGQQRPLFLFWNLKKRPLSPLIQVLTAGGEWLYFFNKEKGFIFFEWYSNGGVYNN